MAIRLAARADEVRFLGDLRGRQPSRYSKDNAQLRDLGSRHWGAVAAATVTARQSVVRTAASVNLCQSG